MAVSENKQFRPDKIDKTIFLGYIQNPNNVLYPINLGINNITVPNNLMPRHFGNNESMIKLKIRELLNTVTKESIVSSVNKLRAVIDEETKERGEKADSSILVDIAQEFLDTFLVSGKQLNEHLQLLNHIRLIAIKEHATRASQSSQSSQISQSHNTNVKMILSKSISEYFTDMLKDKYMLLVAESNVRKMAMRDMDNPDEQDLYYREEEKIINIINLICAMYNHRTTENIRLSSTHIIIVFNKLLTNYSKVSECLKKLGHPDDDCLDEDEYDICRKMATIYEKMMYTLLKDYHADMMTDTLPLKKKDNTGKIIQEIKLSDLINTFKKEVIPNICEMYLISLVKKLNL